MIEDIDYLYKNSVKENLIIIVDSSHRNKKINPYVGEFTVSFPQPFNYVYGIDILNTTIPRTQLMIESNNNSLVFKYGYNILSYDINYTTINILPQDFSSASSFIQRINNQIKPRFNIDNYENTIFDESFSERSINDYSIPRISSGMTPFLFNMSLSTAYTIFGFDCNPTKDNSEKFNSFDNTLDFFCPIRKFPLTFIEPYESLTCKIIESVKTPFEFNTFNFVYKHKSKRKCGSFLQKLTLHANSKFTRPDAYTKNIIISIFNITSQTYLVDNLQVNYNIDESDLIEITRFINDTNLFVFGGTNNHFVLKYLNEYSISIRNVFVNDLNFNIDNVHIGFCYFYELQNININDNIFMSKSICNPESIIHVTHISIYDLTYTLCKNIFPITFNLNFSSEFINNYFNNTTLGLLTKFRLEVLKDTLLNNISDSDIFVLRITKKLIDIESNIIGSEDICEICLQLFNHENGKSYLQFSIEENIEKSFFGQVHLSIGFDEYTINPFECTLFSPKPINIVGSNFSYNYDYIYQIIDNFGIQSPGMLNLATDNYVTLRCPEIENHLRGSYGVNENNNPGMGVLNIDVNGYASGRMDFFSVIYKEFHPIGKLDKMTFRFERKSDKQIYDFKQINLHFLMSVKFLRPTQKHVFDKSILNPNYDPDFLGYFNKNMDNGFYENSSDDDEDEEYIINNDIDDNLNFQNTDRELEKKYNRKYDV